jgi:ArsR family transcriptional regulator
MRDPDRFGDSPVDCQQALKNFGRRPGLVISHKDGLWVNYKLADGHQSPYAANLIGNMRHWLGDEPEIAEILQSLPQIDRHTILGKN